MTSIVLAIVLGVSITFTTSNIIAEEIENDYNFADNVKTIGIFEFNNGKTEVMGIQVFEQLGGFDLREQASVRIEKIVSNTSELYKVADQARQITGTHPKTDHFVNI